MTMAPCPVNIRSSSRLLLKHSHLPDLGLQDDLAGDKLLQILLCPASDLRACLVTKVAAGVCGGERRGGRVLLPRVKGQDGAQAQLVATGRRAGARSLVNIILVVVVKQITRNERAWRVCGEQSETQRRRKLWCKNSVCVSGERSDGSRRQ